MKIGMVGAGSVGGGVYEIIHGRLGHAPTNHSNVSGPSNGFSSPSLGCCVITKICVRDLNKTRNFHIDNQTTITTDIDDIIYDENIDLVIELIGGVDDAKRIVIESLKQGKSVVSANKILIAECLDEIKEAALIGDGKRSSYFAYEAAVGGGVPIIQAMHGCFSGDIIHEVMGITNCTANFMLEKMEKEGLNYNEALKMAQDFGFDGPISSEGHDIAILAKLVR
jgi:homoserine dehydrogenase